MGWVRKGMFATAAALLVGTGFAEAQDDAELVKQVVVSSYVEGIHINRDPDAVRAGFHETFVMSVRSPDGVTHVSREDWVGRLRVGERNPREITHEFLDVTVVGNTATARLQLYIDGGLVFTDVLGLYRFDDGWKLVNKIFERHE